MTIVIKHNQTQPGEVTETRLEGVAMPDLFLQAFFLFKNLKGDVVFMVPIARLASLTFSDNSLVLA